MSTSSVRDGLWWSVCSGRKCEKSSAATSGRLGVFCVSLPIIRWRSWKLGDDIMAELTPQEFAAAKVRGEEHLRGPRAESAHYDAELDRVIVRLTPGIEIDLAPRDAEGWQPASRDDLAQIEVEAF